MIRQKLALVVFAIELTLISVSEWLRIADSGRLDPTSLWMLTPLSYSAVGALVAWRRPENLIGWIYLLPGGFLALIGMSELAEMLGSQPETGVWASILQGISFLGWAGGWSMLSLAWLYFPDGRLPSHRWRVVLWATLMGISLLVLQDFASRLPQNASRLLIINRLGNAGEILLVFSVLGSVASLFYRYRRGWAKVRQQIRWIVSSAALVTITILLVIGTEIWFPYTPLYSALEFIFPVAITLVPISIGIAILRYRLYDIDLIIRKTLVYGALSGLLGLTFFGSVAVFNDLLTTLTGPRSQLATVLSTLAIAALFTPLRRWVQDIIDRQFYRRRYNAERALVDFSAALRDEVDLAALTERLTSVVQETLEPERVGLWLRDSGDPK